MRCPAAGADNNDECEDCLHLASTYVSLASLRGFLTSDPMHLTAINSPWGKWLKTG